MNIIAYQKEGGIAVIHPCVGTTIKELISMVPNDSEYVILENNDLPSERYFRSAWELSNGDVTVNIEKSKDIQRDHWRTLRKPKLEALDLAYMRALESGNTTLQTDTIAQKNALRDVTLTPLPDDLESIKSTIPSILL
jgi:hypothetical protein